MTALLFRPEHARVDEALLEAVQRHDKSITELDDEVLRRPALTLAEVFPATDGHTLPGKFGAIAKSMWTVVDRIFKAGSDHPPDALAKSVQIADARVSVVGDLPTTVYLALWMGAPDPILIRMPILPPVLLERDLAKTLADTRDALRSLIEESCERLNLIAPAALLLARDDERRSRQ